MDDRKKHGWTLWCAAALFAMPLLYVASIGPLTGYVDSHPVSFSKQELEVVRSYCKPFLLLYEHSPEWGQSALMAYLALWH